MLLFVARVLRAAGGAFGGGAFGGGAFGDEVGDRARPLWQRLRARATPAAEPARAPAAFGPLAEHGSGLVVPDATSGSFTIAP